MSLDFFFFSSRRRHTRCSRDWSSDVCSSDLIAPATAQTAARQHTRCKHLAPTDLNRLAGRANRNLAAILCLTLRLRPLLPQRSKPEHIQVKQRQRQLRQAVAFMGCRRDDSTQRRNAFISRQQRRKQQPASIRVVSTLLPLI